MFPVDSIPAQYIEARNAAEKAQKLAQEQEATLRQRQNARQAQAQEQPSQRAAPTTSMLLLAF
jgi:hypothetical protein